MARLMALALLALLLIAISSPAWAATATLTWTDASTNTLSYGVERMTGPCSATGGWTVIATVTAPTKTYADSSPVFNTAYCYRVQGVNNAGVSGYSNLAPFAPPAVAPSGLGVK